MTTGLKLVDTHRDTIYSVITFERRPKPSPQRYQRDGGEFFRETAALVIVFAFLDKLVLREDITIAWSVVAVTLAFFLLVLGIAIERRRM